VAAQEFLLQLELCGRRLRQARAAGGAPKAAQTRQALAAAAGWRRLCRSGGEHGHLQV
jgi:hypothetical protein